MTPQSSNLLRLNKHLALILGISRREADNLIKQQKVQINEKTAPLGARFFEGDKITIDGKELKKSVEYQYIILNKPVGYVCSRKKQGDSPTIYELLPEKYHVLKPVGRLDRHSSGIILLSNNGDFAYQMTHPSFRKTKIYNVRLENDLQPLHQQMISDHGINLEDGPSKLQLERMNETDRKSWIATMHEGRNRQIRRTFGALGYTVNKLHRTNFGKFDLHKTSRSSGVSSANSEYILSGEGEPVGSSTTEKCILDSDSTAESAGILRKSNKYALGDIKPGEFEVVDIQ